MSLDGNNSIVHRCFRCGYCKTTADYNDINCPLYLKHRMESYSPGGILWLINAMMTDEIAVTHELAEMLYSCTMCANCADKCPIEINKYITDVIISAREHIVNRQRLPEKVRKYLVNMMNAGNPLRNPQTERSQWSKGTSIRLFNSKDDYLLYVGDICSYYERGTRVATILADLLNKSKLSFGILGTDEYSDGNDIYVMGEKELFLHFAQKNIQLFRTNEVEKICTISPHAYNAMKNFYPQLSGKMQVFHYTQVLLDCLNTKKIRFTGRFEKRVTFHDPCFLGRWNDGYDSPRAVLTNVPGLELVEMERSRRDALCCGGGGGNCFTDMIGSGSDSPARVRIREAVATGADVLAVACPACLLMLEDALKAENLVGEIEIKDISEILHETGVCA